MSIHRVLTWLCERPRGDFTVGWILRRGWPGFASVALLPKQLELGRAARLIERVIFLGAMAAFIYDGGPAASMTIVSPPSPDHRPTHPQPAAPGSGSHSLYTTAEPELGTYLK